jgi:hypothetical protein
MSISFMLVQTFVAIFVMAKANESELKRYQIHCCVCRFSQSNVRLSLLVDRGRHCDVAVVFNDRIIVGVCMTEVR